MDIFTEIISKIDALTPPQLKDQKGEIEANFDEITGEIIEKLDNTGFFMGITTGENIDEKIREKVENLVYVPIIEIINYFNFDMKHEHSEFVRNYAMLRFKSYIVNNVSRKIGKKLELSIPDVLLYLFFLNFYLCFPKTQIYT
jgi:hypothetical protein